MVPILSLFGKIELTHATRRKISILLKEEGGYRFDMRVAFRLWFGRRFEELEIEGVLRCFPDWRHCLGTKKPPLGMDGYRWNGCPGRIRTYDQVINSHLLYH